MPNKNEIEILITAEVDRAIKNIKKTETQSKKSSKGILKSLGAIKTGYLAIAVAVVGALKVINKFVNLAGIQEKAQRTLSAAMKQAGTFTKEAFKENLKYASSLQKMTTFGDEAILGVQKLLTNFGLQGEELKLLTKATLDLAAATGMDLTAAGSLVAKSVGTSTNAMSRYGIAIEGAAGSAERAQSAINNITKLFGGSAEAEAATYAGRLEQMENSFGDFQETVGFLLLPALTKLFKLLTPIIDQFSKFIEGSNEMSTKFKIATKVIASYAFAFKFAFNIIRVSFLQIPRAVGNGIKLTAGIFKDFIVLILENIRDVATAISNVFSNPRKVISASKALLSNIKNNFADFGNDVAKGAKLFGKRFVQPYKNIGNDFKKLMDTLLDAQKVQAEESIIINDDATSKAIENDQKRIASKKELAEIDKKIAEAFKLSENEVLQQKIDNLLAFLDEFELSAEKQKGITLALEEYKRQQGELTKEADRKNVLATINGLETIFRTASGIASSIVDVETKKYNAIDETDTEARAKQKARLLKASKTQKSLAVSQTLIEAYLSAQRAYSALAGIPIVGPGLGLTAAGLALGAGLLRVEAIKSTPVEGLANGTENARGGTTLVGEAGPELVNLPQGSQVKNSTKTQRILDQSRSISLDGANIYVQANDPKQLVEQIEGELNSMGSTIF